MHHTLNDLEWTDLGKGWTTASITLARGDTATNPTSTKPERQIHGPALVTYERSPNSVNTYVEDAPA